MNICSPKVKKNSVSCLDKKNLIKLAKIINKHTNHKINISNPEVKIHNDIKQIINNTWGCNSERCWFTIIELTDKIPSNLLKKMKSYYKPKKPLSWKVNKNKWLTNIDIDKVLNQYTESNKNFHYYGAVPDDFDKKTKYGECALNNICKINLSELSKKYSCFSVVFNTDPSSKSGKHWTCMYIDINGVNIKNKPSIYYFDSTGEKPSSNVKKLISKLKKQNNNLDYYWNDIQHQDQNTECGIYVMHFIISMLKGKSFHNYIINKKSDKFIEKFRNIYFID